LNYGGRNGGSSPDYSTIYSAEVLKLTQYIVFVNGLPRQKNHEIYVFFSLPDYGISGNII
jgi:hypothetical protein